MHKKYNNLNVFAKLTVTSNLSRFFWYTLYNKSLDFKIDDYGRRVTENGKF